MERDERIGKRFCFCGDEVEIVYAKTAEDPESG